MASVTRSFNRTALSVFRQTASRRKPASASPVNPVTPIHRPFAAPYSQRRPARNNDTDRPNVFEVPSYSIDLLDKHERASYDAMSEAERQEFDEAWRSAAEELGQPDTMNQILTQMDKDVKQINETHYIPLSEPAPRSPSVWAEDEVLEEALVEDIDANFKNDAITSMAHAELEEHRELRQYARIAAWEMPLLSSLAKPFELPSQDQILRFRYTTYMGETHPAETKVVVEFCPSDIAPEHLTDDQKTTLLKLAGTRYNPSTGIVRMSSEKFPTRAQNKRYLGDLVDAMIKEAKEGDAFADIPLDTRHHTPKPKYKFPEEWLMTEERQKQLEANRAEKKRAETQGLLLAVDGKQVIEHAILTVPSLKEPVTVAAPTAGKEKLLAAVRATKGKSMRRR
ncbi:hypothetical protein AJ80_03523 [Polytolypa hystricis UAMH7299]|uniref:Small ribosomal subunit protein mS35 mitochondrial conserved domain-containing protein n=1 Tax=Polytolypa hystricis (strain UAMH7299) TaxID=1447883 RepID=A0A2B7YIS8_POLH7|nr:hypothetical protein AJ80_03523 [Polytolypa hystricis UAMH7299]